MSLETVAIPLLASDTTTSKWGVSPRITAPNVITTSYLPVRASCWEIIGNSKEPGTQATSSCSLDSDTSIPCLDKQSKHPLNNLLVIRSLKRAITIATRNDDEFSKVPSIVPFFKALYTY